MFLQGSDELLLHNTSIFENKKLRGCRHAEAGLHLTEIHYAPAPKFKRLILSRETIALYCENDTHTRTLWAEGRV